MSEHLKEEVIIPFLDGRLSAAERAPLQAHLAACAACRAQVDELRAVVGVLGEWPAVAPSPDFDAALRARVSEETPHFVSLYHDLPLIERMALSWRAASWRSITAHALAWAIVISMGFWGWWANSPAPAPPPVPAPPAVAVAPQPRPTPSPVQPEMNGSDELAVLDNPEVLDNFKLLSEFGILFEVEEDKEEGKTL
jgi:anti-sigma factor RsiW